MSLVLRSFGYRRDIRADRLSEALLACQPFQAGNAFFSKKEFVAASRCYGFGIVRLKEAKNMDEKEKSTHLVSSPKH